MSELPISVTTEYTYPIFRKFSYFSTYFRSTGNKIFWIILAILWFLILLPLSVVLAVFDPSNSSVLIFIIVFTVVFAVYLNILPRLVYKQQYISKGITETTVFTADGMEVIIQSNTASGSQKWAWQGIHSVYEVNAFFYIYIAKNQADIVDKSKMSEGDVEAVRSLLAAVMGPKFYYSVK